MLMFHVDGHSAIRRRIGTAEERVEVGPGDVSLLPGTLSSSWSWTTSLHIMKVFIEPSYLNELAHELTGAPNVTLQLRHDLRVADATLAELGRDMIHELSPPYSLGAARGARLIGERIAIHLLRHYVALEESVDRERKLTRAESALVCSFIEAHLHEEIHIRELAGMFGLREQQFGRVFQRTFDCLPHEHIRDQRLRGARELLTSTHETIAQIAAATGFADQSHLTRRFRERFGVPPAAFRRSARA